MHKEGFPAPSIGRIIAHYTRGLYEGERVDYDRRAGGGHIDTSRSHLNYQLGECHGVGWVRERLQGVYFRPQDANKPKMLDIVITLPTDEPPENARAFFEAAYKSLIKQYRKKNNIVGAWVHLDESRPHMHFAFLPIVDKTMKKNPEVKEGLSQKAYFPSKASLQVMHKTTQQDVSQALGHRVALLNEVTKQQGGNKSISELKTESRKAMEKAMKQKAKLEEARDGISKGAEWFGLGKKFWKVSLERMPVVWSLAKAGAEAKATEDERQAELRNAKAKEKQADQEREAVQRQLDEANREIQRLREQVSEAETYLEAPEAEKAELKNFMKYTQKLYRDFADVVHRELVQTYAEAGGDVQPVLDTMERAFNELGVANEEDMRAYLLDCVQFCKIQAKQFFRCMEDGQQYTPPERSASWHINPSETDFSQQEENPVHLERLQHLVLFEVTKEKRNLFQQVRAMEKSKTASRSRSSHKGR